MHHKEECPGHLRKMGMAHLEKAKGFHQEQNWMQSLCYAELALTKLKQLKDHRLETVKIIDDAFACKFDALQNMDRHKEALECAKERYTMWAMNHMRNPRMFGAAFGLIQSCIHNKAFEDAALYAHTAHEMVVNDADGIIPSDQRESLLARGSLWLSVATMKLAEAGGIPPEEKQKAGEEAIALARKALEIHTQLHGTMSERVALDMIVLADALNYFNDVDDDEVLRLYEQAIAITSRVEGSSSSNVAVGENNLGVSEEQKEHRIPMIWTDASLTWSWQYPTIMKQLGSIGLSITWMLLKILFATPLKSRRRYGSSESPKQQRLELKCHCSLTRFISCVCLRVLITVYY